jgi:Gas vesicle protein G
VGLVKGLLTLPLAPLNGVRAVAEVLAGEAERELERRESPERALADLEARLANGEIDEEEAAAQEAQLIERMLSRRATAGVGGP